MSSKLHSLTTRELDKLAKQISKSYRASTNKDEIGFLADFAMDVCAEIASRRKRPNPYKTGRRLQMESVPESEGEKIARENRSY
jgi:hypothetical protein